MPTQINVTKLANVAGVGKEAAERVDGVFDDVEEIARAQPADLAKMAQITEDQAVAIVAWARVKVGAPAPATTPPAGNPSAKRPKLDRLSPMQLLELIRDGNYPEDMRGDVRSYVEREFTHFTRDAEGKINASNTVSLRQFARDTRKVPTSFNNEVVLPIASMFKVEYAANPITGEALEPGNAWLKLPEDRRFYAALGEELNMLRGVDVNTLLWELQQPTLPPRWSDIEIMAKQLSADDQRVINARRRLVFDASTRQGGGNDTNRPFGNAGRGQQSSSGWSDWSPVISIASEDLPQIRAHILQRYNLTELQDLCAFGLQPRVDFESLPGEGKAGKVRELITYMMRNSRIFELVQAIHWAPERGDVVFDDKVGGDKIVYQPVYGAAEIAEQQARLATHRRTLGYSLQQAAAFGGIAFAPPATNNAISTARADIARIKGILRASGVNVADHPDDIARR